MKKKDFDKLNPEVQKEFLERGGTIEYPKAAGQESLGYMRWGYSGSYGGGVKHLGKSNLLKKRPRKKKNKY